MHAFLDIVVEEKVGPVRARAPLGSATQPTALKPDESVEVATAADAEDVALVVDVAELEEEDVEAAELEDAGAEDEEGKMVDEAATVDDDDATVVDVAEVELVEAALVETTLEDEVTDGAAAGAG